MATPADLAMAPGAPAPLGATLGAGGVNFAVVAPEAEAVHVCLFDADDRETARFLLPTRFGDVHCGFLAGAAAGCRYGLRADGPWAPDQALRFDPAKLLTDPYAVRLDRPYAWHPELATHGADTAALVPKAIVEASAPPVAPQAPRPLGLIYEVPIKAFTMRHPEVPEALRGTMGALAEPAIIAHLKGLGVDTVELMPLSAWVDERHLPPLGLANAWGYNPITFLAPDPRLAPGGMAEIRTTLATLHEAGLRVILDVVFNHSGESDIEGPTLSLRGLGNALYYAHTSDHALVNDTGCGNTLALENAPVVKLVMDALRHWADAGFDGFRFDLATILGRSPQGFDVNAPLLSAIAQDPVLSRLALVAEPWDATMNGYRLGGFGFPWHEWNDRYRDHARRFWRGDAHATGDFATVLCGSADLFAKSHRPPSASVNFLAAHDGFTLRDLVHFDHKQNRANGEDNRDGNSGEISWVSATPDADVRALLATLMVSRGTLMLTAGDEFGRTQDGNNNAYAQDNDVTWLDWQGADAALMAFVGRLAALRRELAPLHADLFLEGRDAEGHGLADATWLDAAGQPVSVAEWSAPDFSTFGLILAARGTRIALWFNRAQGEVACTLPAPRSAHLWQIALDSADNHRQGPLDGASVTVAGRSVLVVVETAQPAAAEPPAGTARAGATDAELAALAEAAGIQPEWHEIYGTHHRVTPETQRALLAAMHLPATTSDDVRASLSLLRRQGAARVLPLNATLPQTRAGHLPVVLPEAMGRRRLALRLTAETGDERLLEIAPDALAPQGALAHDGVRYGKYALAVPALPPGFYRLELDAFPGVQSQLIVHPQGCHLPDELAEPHRTFGLSAHLYALRDARDAGIGDLETLGQFADGTRRVGGITAGINPLHHLFPTDRERASPYQPSDRRFIDPIYMDLDGLVAELGGTRARAVMDESAGVFASLRAASHVDYTRAWEVKKRVLRAVFADCAQRPLPELDQFIANGGEALLRHALFESLATRAGTVSRKAWPTAWQAPAPHALPELAQEFRGEMRFQAFLQWCLARQLDRAGARGPALGLYRDLALGVAPDGGEVWARPDLFAQTVSLGAPPDPFAAAGQKWHLPPFIPQRLQGAFYRPLVDILSANMRAAGVLRIDHVLGFTRQFWVPEGAEGSAGAYVTFPADDLIALTALLSSRARCCVIGEDLGTVPAGFRDRLAAADILSYRVLWLERDPHGALLSPQTYPRLSVACLSSHDLPTFLGWAKAADDTERQCLDAALATAGIAPGESDADLMVAAHTLLAQGTSTLMLIQADDLAGETEPLNIPGTDRENPNWRRRIATPVDTMASGDLAERVIGAVAAIREHKVTPPFGSAEAESPPAADPGLAAG